MFRMLPSSQDLKALETPGAKVDDRLEERNDFVRVQSRDHVAQLNVHQAPRLSASGPSV
jgi:hypothetical protein